MATRVSACLLRRSLVCPLLASKVPVQRYSAWTLPGQLYSARYSTAKTAPAPARLAPTVERGASKLFKNADQAVADIQSGSTILSSGFGLCGVAGTIPPAQGRASRVQDANEIETIISAIHRRGADNLHSLTAISNNAGAPEKGGLATLTQAGQVNRLILSYLGNNKALEKKYLTGDISIELCPQGTLAERLRAGGAGIPAFFTPTGVRTFFSHWVFGRENS